MTVVLTCHFMYGEKKEDFKKIVCSNGNNEVRMLMQPILLYYEACTKRHKRISKGLS